MYNEQNTLREQIKMCKWRYNKSYKEAAAYVGMNYNSFVNWLHDERIKLGYTKKQKLKAFIAKAAAAA